MEGLHDARVARVGHQVLRSLQLGQSLHCSDQGAVDSIFTLDEDLSTSQGNVLVEQLAVFLLAAIGAIRPINAWCNLSVFDFSRLGSRVSTCFDGSIRQKRGPLINLVAADALIAKRLGSLAEHLIFTLTLGVLTV